MLALQYINMSNYYLGGKSSYHSQVNSDNKSELDEYILDALRILEQNWIFSVLCLHVKIQSTFCGFCFLYLSTLDQNR